MILTKVGCSFKSYDVHVYLRMLRHILVIIINMISYIILLHGLHAPIPHFVKALAFDPTIIYSLYIINSQESHTTHVIFKQQT